MGGGGDIRTVWGAVVGKKKEGESAFYRGWDSLGSFVRKGKGQAVFRREEGSHGRQSNTLDPRGNGEHKGSQETT